MSRNKIINNRTVWRNILSLSIHAAPISITGLSVDSSSAVSNDFTLVSTSTGSPPSSVSWSRYGITLNTDGRHTLTSKLSDGTTATYTHYLSVDDTPDNILGQYTISVTDNFGNGDEESISINGEFCFRFCIYCCVCVCVFFCSCCC